MGFRCCDSLYRKQAEEELLQTEASRRKAEEAPEPEKEEPLPYRFHYLLTKPEWSFYKRLKAAADRYHLHILAKVRLADLVQVEPYYTGLAFEKYFSKIKAKHVDFVLCNPENLAVRFILELEDSSHYDAARAKRDDFVDKVLKKCGYRVIHTYGDANLEELIERLIR